VRKKLRFILSKWQTPVAALLLLVLLLTDAGCFLNQHIQPYYGRVIAPYSSEFRWSDGGLPQTFDPAFAAAPPETDAVRALFEGLTDYDPSTLAAVPAVATRWEASEGGSVWTFYLRRDARWSNGEPVTANDFVISWKRTLRLGGLAPHTELLSNIVGAATSVSTPTQITTQPSSELGKAKGATNKRVPRSFGAEVVNDHVLRVHLEHPDQDFPALVAHPVFRPVKPENEDSALPIAPPHIVSNGAFVLSETRDDGVILERADSYWAKEDVSLERVEFVSAKDAETALEAYRAGELDAVTNAAFEPLALKLLAPYRDFRRSTYGALTYYSFNTSHSPFDDVRVREALAIAIDRERISQDEMGGSTEPAKRFFPDQITAAAKPTVGKAELLERDITRARGLLGEAGYPEGSGFPQIKMLVNKNDQQRLVAQAIARMWRSVLNVETEIVVKGWEEYEAAIRAGEYDVVRRGIVMQTTNELTNIRLLFQQETQLDALLSKADQSAPTSPAGATRKSESGAAPLAGNEGAVNRRPIESEIQALNELDAFPVYFASSYALVKPYVVGFNSNVLDVPSLKRVRIDTSWKEPVTAKLVWTKSAFEWSQAVIGPNNLQSHRKH
jgi:oligopeptide transport system substrate-binding protein